MKSSYSSLRSIDWPRLGAGMFARMRRLRADGAASKLHEGAKADPYYRIGNVACVGSQEV